MNIISSLYSAANSYLKAEPDPQHKLHKLVEGLKERMNDPKISKKEKNEIAALIGSLEKAAKDRRLSKECTGVALAILRTCSSSAGAAGIAVESLLTSGVRADHAKSEGVVHPARVVAGGVRRKNPKKYRKTDTKNIDTINERQRVVAATMTVAQHEITSGATSWASSMANSTLNRAVTYVVQGIHAYLP